MQKLRERWGLQHNYQVWLVLLVFALTGSTIGRLKGPIQTFTGLIALNPKLLRDVIYYILALPFYQLILVAYGYLFGLGKFFWEKEKRFYAKIAAKFSQKKEGV